MREIQISIIIPAYNAENYIGRALKSILVNPIETIEILVINDGSTDETLQIVEGIKAIDARVRILTTENRGVSAARNYGMENAEGKYLMFLDADDEIIPEGFARAVEITKVYEKDVIIFPYYVNNKRGDSERLVNPFSNGEILIEEFCKCIVESTYMNFCWGKLFKREFLCKNNVAFEVGRRIGEDVLFQIEMTRKNPSLYYDDTVLVRYFQVPTSVMHQYGMERFQYLVDDFKMRMDLADRIELNERSNLYYDVGTNLLSYVKHMSKNKNCRNAFLELKSVFRDKNLVEIIENYPIYKANIPKKIICILIRKKLYFLTVVILHFL